MQETVRLDSLCNLANLFQCFISSKYIPKEKKNKFHIVFIDNALKINSKRHTHISKLSEKIRYWWSSMIRVFTNIF